MIGNKRSGRGQLWFDSSAIKPMDRSHTAKTISLNGMSPIARFIKSDLTPSVLRSVQL